MVSKRLIGKFLLLNWCVLLLSNSASALTPKELDKVIATVDERQRNTGDYKSLVYIEENQKSKPTKLLEALVFRRDEDKKWMILFSKPKSETGKGYLKIDKNLFMYEPALGKWDRMTERARIGGTNSQRSDFDEPRFAEQFDYNFVKQEKLGKFIVNQAKLVAKATADVAYPIVMLWLDVGTMNILKRQDYSLSNKLMRTTYYPKWTKMFSKSKGADVYIPDSIRIYDEVEKENSTTIVLKQVSLDPLEANIFTKAWLEKQSK
jgi:hypothetical protein